MRVKKDKTNAILKEAACAVSTEAISVFDTKSRFWTILKSIAQEPAQQ